MNLNFNWPNFLFGTRGDDLLNGTQDNDWIFSGRGDDTIDAGEGDDLVLAGRGDDRIRAGEGDDIVDGGRGFDIAEYVGSIRDYTIQTNWSWFGTTTTLSRFGSNGERTEHDLLRNIEAVYFEADDYTLFLDGRNNAALAGDDEVSTDEDTPLNIDEADLLSNDQEYDGDPLSIISVGPTSSTGAAVTLQNGQVQYDPGTLFDYLQEGETATDTFSYQVDDGKGGFDIGTVLVNIAGVNDKSVISAPLEVLVAENDTAIVLDADATDVDSGPITFSLAGGADDALFDINQTTGELRFKSAPDFETPLDSNSDNVYTINISADDGDGGVSTQAVSVTVTDVTRERIAFDMVGSADQRLISFTNAAPVFNSTSDVFAKLRVGVDTIPGQLADNSTSGTPADSLGIIDTATNLDVFFGISDTENNYNSGPVEATWVFDISGYDNLWVSLDAAAMGDFEASDVFDLSYSIDGGDTNTLFSFRVDETATQTYTLADGDSFMLSDPMTHVASGGMLSNVLQNFSTNLVGIGAELTITLTAETNGGSEAFALQNLIVEGDGSGAGGGSSFSVSANEDELLEGDIGSGEFGFTITRSGDLSQAGSVDYQLVSSERGNLGAGTLQFFAGDTTSSVPSNFLADMTVEPDEIVTITLSNPVEGTLGTDIATTTIRDDDTITRISEIQGTATASPIVGDYVFVSAIVTYTMSNGFFLQEEDADYDADPLSSEGIFVFTGGAPAVQAGDVVKFGGSVDEFFGMTQLTDISEIITLSTGNTLPTAATFMVSPDFIPDLEAYEGMRVSVTSGTSDPLTVTENFNLARFGEIAVSAGNKTQATQLYDAQTQADLIADHIEANQNNRLLIEDGVSTQNPDGFAFVPAATGDNGNGFWDSEDTHSETGPTIRLGAELEGPAEGVLNFSFGDYRLLVEGTLPIDEATNGGARQLTPADVGGDLKAASFNVLNYFTTLGSRGANSEADLIRQTDKIVTAMLEIDADVFALQELENNGFGEDSAIAALVDALNIAAAAQNLDASYAFVDPTGNGGSLGTDAITNGIIYRTSALTLQNSDVLAFSENTAASTFALADVLNPFVNAGDQLQDFQRNRPAIAATFEDENGEAFTIAVNHFKSKGDSNLQDLAQAAQAALDGGNNAINQADIDALTADGNFDQNDGQGFWNLVRAEAAAELADWLQTTYSGAGGDTDFLILGDLNAYAQEDPVQAIRDDAGFADIIETYIGQDAAYSFVFDGQRGSLDHGLVSSTMEGQITGATEWHINADEPGLLSYNSRFTNPDFYNNDVFAASDHDPLIIGLQLGDPFDDLIA